MSTSDDDSPELGGTPQGRSSSHSAPKNKHCPFCGESFTSSSLGRHLDLYIKEKNPKPADGIHDVDRIRQIRGTITRRQPKRNTRAASNITNDLRASSVHSGTAVHNVGRMYSQQSADSGPKFTMNKPTWEATGVITDLLAKPGLSPGEGTRKHGNISRSAIARQVQIAQADKMRCRAAELALQELLDSVNAARTQTSPASPFDFDFLSQTFPGLCLKLLPRQPTLYSAQVIESPKHCPIGPPGQEQYQVLQEVLKAKIEQFSVQFRNDTRQSSIRSTLSSMEEDQPESSVYSSIAHATHLERAWEVWVSTSEAQKVSLWHLEVFRGLGYYQDEHKRLNAALDKARAEQAHLRLQIERLNECQQPKEYTFQIPTNWHVSKETTSALISQQADIPPGREALIEKWTKIIKTDPKYQRPLPGLSVVNNTNEMDIDEPDAVGEVLGEEEASEDAAGEDDEDTNSRFDGK